MVKVHRPKFSGKKQLNCLRKVRPVNKGLKTHFQEKGSAELLSETKHGICTAILPVVLDQEEVIISSILPPL